MPCKYGCFNRLKYNVEINGIKFCGMIEAPKIININKDFKFRRKNRIVE
jgi:hypothetical protein